MKPKPTRCHQCGTVAAETVCHTCKTERPAYAALKAISEKFRRVAGLPACIHYPNALCGCGERGECLEAA